MSLSTVTFFFCSTTYCDAFRGQIFSSPQSFFCVINFFGQKEEEDGKGRGILQPPPDSLSDVLTGYFVPFTLWIPPVVCNQQPYYFSWSSFLLQWHWAWLLRQLQQRERLSLQSRLTLSVCSRSCEAESWILARTKRKSSIYWRDKCFGQACLGVCHSGLPYAKNKLALLPQGNE